MAKRPKSSGVTRVVYGTFGTLVAAFILWSSVQVVSVCFGLRATPEKPLAEPCASSVRALLSAIDRATRASTGISDPRAARDAFTKALSPEWDTQGVVAARCSADDDQQEAYANVLRLERELEDHAADGASRSGALRRDLERRLGIR